MTIIIKKWQGKTIRIREDGYFCLTDMANATDKTVANWLRNQKTTEYLEELSTIMEIPARSEGEFTALIEGKTGRNNCTWGESTVAIRFAQWCSIAFAAQVDRWFIEMSQAPAVPESQILSPGEQLLVTAKAILTLERNQQLYNHRLEQLEQQIKNNVAAIDDLAPATQTDLTWIEELPPGDEPVPEIGTRGKINRIIRGYGYFTGQENYRELWNNLYSNFYYRHHIDLKARAKNASAGNNKKISPLDIAANLNYLDQLYSLAFELYASQIQSIAHGEKQYAPIN